MQCNGLECNAIEYNVLCCNEYMHGLYNWIVPFPKTNTMKYPPLGGPKPFSENPARLVYWGICTVSQKPHN